MTYRDDESERASLSSLVSRVADGMGRLVSEHLTLARLELTRDAKEIGGQVSKVVAFVPFLLVGYVFLCAAAAVALWDRLGGVAALAVVGGANLLLGAVGIALAVHRLGRRRVLNDSLKELKSSAQALAPRDS